MFPYFENVSLRYELYRSIQRASIYTKNAPKNCVHMSKLMLLYVCIRPYLDGNGWLAPNISVIEKVNHIKLWLNIMAHVRDETFYVTHSIHLDEH